MTSEFTRCSSFAESDSSKPCSFNAGLICSPVPPNPRPMMYERTAPRVATACAVCGVSSSSVSMIGRFGLIAIRCSRRNDSLLVLAASGVIEFWHTTEGFYDTRPQRSGRCKCHGYLTKCSRLEQRASDVPLSPSEKNVTGAIDAHDQRIFQLRAALA